MKRAFDLVAAVLGLVVLSPLLALVATAIVALDGRPVFYRQVRVGRGGRPFRIWKFRTMRPAISGAGREITVGGDPRVTRVGAFLRRHKLDELPQLLNVVAGEMSLVGPRPEVPRYVAFYNAEQRRVLDARPGITDPASLAYRDEESMLARAADPEAAYLAEVMPAKLRLNLEYAERATLRSDLRLVARTLLALGAPATARRAPDGEVAAPGPVSTAVR